MPERRMLRRQTRPTGQGRQEPAAEPNRETARRGRALPSELRSLLEAGFGTSLNTVRMRDDPQAQAVASAFDAVAVTSRGQILLAPGAPAPNTSRGVRMIAHEVAHVLQQRAAPPAVDLSQARSSDVAERSAREAANAVVEGQTAQAPAGGTPVPPVQRVQLAELDEDERESPGVIPPAPAPPLPPIGRLVANRLLRGGRSVEEGAPPLPEIPARLRHLGDPLHEFLGQLPPPRHYTAVRETGLPEEAATAFGQLNAMFGQFAYQKGMVDPARNPKLRPRAKDIDAPQLWERYAELAAQGNVLPGVPSMSGNRVIRALSPAERAPYEVSVRYTGPDRGTLYWTNRQATGGGGNEIASTAGMETAFGGNENRAIYALTPDGRLYLADQEKERRALAANEDFYHTSLVAGEQIAAAGEIEIGADGRLVGVSTGSGHYQPNERYLVQILKHLVAQGVDVSAAYAEHLGVQYSAAEVLEHGGLQPLQTGLLRQSGVQTHVAPSGRITRGWNVDTPGEERFEVLTEAEQQSILTGGKSAAGDIQAERLGRRAAAKTRQAAEAVRLQAQREAADKIAGREHELRGLGFFQDSAGQWWVKSGLRPEQTAPVTATDLLTVLDHPAALWGLLNNLFSD